MLGPLSGALIVSSALLLQDAPPRAAAYPQPGSDIPGPFAAYNVTGRKKDYFHCLVSEHDLNPVVMVIVRGTEVPPALKYLLGKLDNRVQKNPNVRLAGFAVFHSDRLENVARDDDLREGL